MGLLKQLRLECEARVRPGETLYTLDFYLAKYWLGIEVDGSIHDGRQTRRSERIQHAQRRRRSCREMRISLIRIHHSELADDDLSGVINRFNRLPAWVSR